MGVNHGIAVAFLSVGILAAGGAPTLRVVAAPPVVPPTNHLPANCENEQDAACFYYVDGEQAAVATGASVSITQADPAVGPNDQHALAEMAIESADGQQIVEVGWIVAEGVNGDSLPHLFTYHWVKGGATCYNLGCGFVPSSGAKVPTGGKVMIDKTGTFKMAYAKGRWVVTYDGSEVGYFPESLWTNAGVRFTKAALVQVFGEVAGSEITDPTTQMGNGTFGSTPASAVFNAFTLLGSSTKPNLYVYDTAPTWYDFGQPSKVGFHFGGPGA